MVLYFVIPCNHELGKDEDYNPADPAKMMTHQEKDTYSEVKSIEMLQCFPHSVWESENLYRVLGTSHILH